MNYFEEYRNQIVRRPNVMKQLLLCILICWAVFSLFLWHYNTQNTHEDLESIRDKLHAIETQNERFSSELVKQKEYWKKKDDELGPLYFKFQRYKELYPNIRRTLRAIQSSPLLVICWLRYQCLHLGWTLSSEIDMVWSFFPQRSVLVRELRLYWRLCCFVEGHKSAMSQQSIAYIEDLRHTTITTSASLLSWRWNLTLTLLIHWLQ
jgi:hypothetical protein